ncbi:hypothetical protein ACLFKT_41705, partial [Paraburkholderia sp. BR14261]
MIKLSRSSYSRRNFRSIGDFPTDDLRAQAWRIFAQTIHLESESISLPELEPHEFEQMRTQVESEPDRAADH